MLVLYLLILLSMQSMTISQLNMYYTENDFDRYCLLLFTDRLRSDDFDTYKIFIPIHHITSYCLRLTEENYTTVISHLENVTAPGFTFVELKEKNITSEMLLSWSSTIDLAEQYEMFLINNLSSLSNETFYNCTSLWFGPFCRFKFDYSSIQSFNDIVKITFGVKRVIDKHWGGTCYKHLSCQTYLPCLDWREICDGNINCLDGSDEKDCWQLEVNQCTNEEYKCRNGQCIPMEFLLDVPDYSDCLDQTDEPISEISVDCYLNPSFTCEENMCRPSELEFPCGDGQCTNGINACSNGRSPILTDDYCSNATWCLSEYPPINGWFCLRCKNTNCIKSNCPSVFELRSIPPIFGHVRLMFSNTIQASKTVPLPVYVCYDEKICENIFPVAQNIGNLTCYHFNISEIGESTSRIGFANLIKHIKKRFRTCSQVQNTFGYCNYSSMYHCANSTKCVSKRRLLDGFQDCLENDDEEYKQSCSLEDAHQRFQCLDQEQKCFSSLVVEDKKRDCRIGEDDQSPLTRYRLNHIYFPHICDGKADLFPITIQEQYETDETNCEYWPCDNTYTRCNKFWNCKNGIDEMHCPHSIDSTLRGYCDFSDNILNSFCSPVNQTDQRNNYHVFSYFDGYQYVLCWNNTKSIPYLMFCDINPVSFCPLKGVSPFCGIHTIPMGSSLCKYIPDVFNDAEKFLCNLRSLNSWEALTYFKLRNVSPYPLDLTNMKTLDESNIERKRRSTVPNPIIDYKSSDAWRCNRGISIRIRNDVNRSRLYCLCPPSYYGETCQYENERVSITVQIRVSSDWKNLFIFLFTLIDNEKNIEFYDYIEYLPIRDCKTKYNIYLLYSTRPKNSSKTYSVQIDAFHQLTLTYRTSWIYPLQFAFLPVYRLPILLKTPMSIIESVKKQCWPRCIHGECLSYINNENLTFCHCESGWSGIQCNVKHTCNCAPGSLCISNSICLCPLGRFGRRCHLVEKSCQSHPCLHGGRCLIKDRRYRHPNENWSICICLEGYTGDHCEYPLNQTEINLSFDNLESIPSSLLIHLISVEESASPKRTSIMKKVRFDEYSIRVLTSIRFHMAFAQIVNDYYLIIVRENAINFEQISTKVISSYRCRSIVELFGEIFSNEHLLKRIKSYQIPCAKDIQLNCFYDDVHICLCTRDRQANCFEFDHNMKYNCSGLNFCENQGNCFLDDETCPTSSFCTCPTCVFGSKCQFSTKGSTLSLDIILGYHIRSNIEFNQQQLIVKISIMLIIIVFVFGSINSFLCFETFRQKRVCNVGCGLYLYISSIISMITILFLTLKFSFLLLIQIGSITNRTFFYIECLSIDFLLRSLLSINDWLSAFVAIERAVNVLKGVKFNKTKSKQVAKWMIMIIIVFTSISFICDPLYRDLVDDEDEQRTLCVTKYSLSMQIVDWIANIFHFLFPFLINLISSLIIIFSVARTRSKAQKSKSYKEHLREQIQYHKHLLISPSVLVILAVPRLIISFLSSCMKSPRHSWFYLFGYFISFIPSIMTFIIFVLPSERYKEEFKKAMSNMRK